MGSNKNKAREVVIAEYEPHWYCPKCGELTDKSDEIDDWFDNGDCIDVVCHHVDPDDDECDRECGHRYVVDLRG